MRMRDFHLKFRWEGEKRDGESRGGRREGIFQRKKAKGDSRWRGGGKIVRIWQLGTKKGGKGVEKKGKKSLVFSLQCSHMVEEGEGRSQHYKKPPQTGGRKKTEGEKKPKKTRGRERGGI